MSEFKNDNKLWNAINYPCKISKRFGQKEGFMKDMMVTEKTFPVKFYPRRFPPPPLNHPP